MSARRFAVGVLSSGVNAAGGALFAAAVVLLGACTSGGGTPSPDGPSSEAADGSGEDDPVGGSTYEDEHVAFEVPAHLVRTPAGEELSGGLEVEFLDDPSGVAPVPEQVTFGYGVPDDPTFSIAAWPTFAFGPVTGDDEQTLREEVEVDGASEALQVGYRVHRPDLDEPLRIVAVGAIVEGPDGPLVADLRYYAPESEFDEDVAARVLESLTAAR